MVSIPPSTAPFFQEYTFSKLEAQKHAPLIIERLLTYGDRSEVRWLFETYGQAKIRGWLSEFGSIRLPRRRYHLWCVLLDQPEQARAGSGIWRY